MSNYFARQEVLGVRHFEADGWERYCFSDTLSELDVAICKDEKHIYLECQPKL